AGRDVLVEKPLGATAGETARLVEASRRAGRFLAVGHSERFNPVVRALARGVAPTAVTSLHFRRVGSARARDALLLNLGVHDLDLAAYLTRSPLIALTADGNGYADAASPDPDERVDAVLAASRG